MFQVLSLKFESRSRHSVDWMSNPNKKQVPELRTSECMEC